MWISVSIWDVWLRCQNTVIQQSWIKRRKSINTSIFVRLLSTWVEKEEQGQSQETQTVPAPPTPVAEGRVAEAGVPLHSAQPRNWTIIYLYTGVQKVWIIDREKDKSTRLQRSRAKVMRKMCSWVKSSLPLQVETKCLDWSRVKGRFLELSRNQVWNIELTTNVSVFYMA